MPATLQKYDFSYKSKLAISQSLKYHVRNKETYQGPHFLSMGLQALSMTQGPDDSTNSSK